MKNKGKALIVVAVCVAISMAFIFTAIQALAEGTKGDPVTLRADFWFTGNGDLGRAITKAMEIATERSKGQIRFTTTWAGAKVNQTGALHILDDNVSDVSYVANTVFPAQLPRSFVTCMYGPMTNAWAGMMAALEFVKTSDTIRNEWLEYNAVPIWPCCFPPNVLMSREAIPNVDSLKGKRFVAHGQQAQIVANLGGAPSAIPAGEMYDALAKGTVNTIWWAIIYVNQWSWYENLKYLVPNSNIGGAAYYICFNKKTFDKLPASTQKVLVDMGPEVANLIYEQTLVNRMPDIVNNIFPKAGIEQLKWTDEDMETVRKVGIEPANEKWLKDMEKRGYTDIRKVLKLWEGLNDKYNNLLPQVAAEQGWKQIEGLPY